MKRSHMAVLKYISISMIILILFSFSGCMDNVKMKYYTNSIGMEFVLIPAGEFDMGSPPEETGKKNDEGPVHHVTIDTDFYMGKYEVTQRQWSEIMVFNPSDFKSKNMPVNRVSWNDAREFIKRLNEKEDTDKYRLPTEAEWEYAARAGTKTKYFFGKDSSQLDDYVWYNKNSMSYMYRVGQKEPNPWELYDIYGNICEWVQDEYHNNYDQAPTDGSAWGSENASVMVSRGGSWASPSRVCRSAARFKDHPDTRNTYLGFRLVIEG